MKTAGRSHEMTIKFKLMKTDELRVVMALNFMDVFGTVPEAKCKIKDSKASVNFRNKANRIFVSSKDNVEELIKASELYSKSIATAPNKSPELALAFANRSANLMELQKYTESLDDIDRALELNYPNHLKGMLLCRKIECLNFLKDKSIMQGAIEEARCWLESMHLNDDEKRKFEEKLKSTEHSNCLKSFSKSSKTKDFPTFISHKEIPCASEALAINYNEKFGRHIVTTRNVEPGEILVIEKPYSTILMPEEIYTHCSHCLQVHWAMIPCEFCIYAMYCSHKCKKEAYKQYHDVECTVTGYLLDLDYNKRSLFSMRLAILALREAGSIETLRNNLKKMDDCEGIISI